MKPLQPHTYSKLAVLALAGTLAFTLTGCSDQDPAPGETTQSTVSAEDAAAATETALAVDASQTAVQVLADNQAIHSAESIDEAQAVDLDLSSSELAQGMSKKDDVVTITAAGRYRVTGTLAGQLEVNVPDGKVQLILDGVSITSAKGAAISAVEVDELNINLAQGSQNTLEDAATYDEALDPNAALYSAGDTTINGSGSLTVTGNYNDGITAKDGLLIESGTITVTASDDAIRGKDYISITGGTLNLTSGGDALTSDNDTEPERGFIAVSGGTIVAAAQGDGIAAATDVVITGGEVSVTTGTGASTTPDDETSTKGIKSGTISVIEGGVVTIDAQDDAVHSDGAIHVAGGELTASSGDDGIHAEGSFRASAGILEIPASYEGIEAYHIDLAGADVTVVASDDGLNATGGSSDDQSTQGGEPAGQGGQAPEDMNGQNPPELPADMEDLPEGMPEIPEGMTELPDDGQRPDMPSRGDGQGFGGQGFGGMEEAGDYSITISAGTINIYAEGDGLDSNGSLTISGGNVVVDGPTRGGNGSIDANGTFTMTGGSLVTRGTSDMPVNPSDDSQYWIAFSSLSAASGDTVEITADDGTVVYQGAIAVDTQRVFLSSPDLKGATTYTLTINGSESGTAQIS